MEFRKVFNSIPEQFDKYRPRYTPELFADFIAYARITPESTVLELGPGTGQATDPILDTGCAYHGIEIGENLAAKMMEKYGERENFHIVVDDFITHDFGEQRFDVIYSAATIQWIPEKIAFTRCYELLKPGGVLAMFMTRTDERTPNAHFYDRIQQAYDIYFRPEKRYTCHMVYENAVHYGFEDFHYMDWKHRKFYTADEYCDYLAATQVSHITLREPHRSRFFGAVHAAVAENGNCMIHDDTTALYLTRKPAKA